MPQRTGVESELPPLIEMLTDTRCLRQPTADGMLGCQCRASVRSVAQLIEVIGLESGNDDKVLTENGFHGIL